MLRLSNMPTCRMCLKIKEAVEFPYIPSKNKYDKRCKPCKRKYDRDYWEKTKWLRNIRKTEHKRLRKERNVGHILEYLKRHPCKDCGETDPVVLEFDHRGDKNYHISEMSDFSLSNLKAEIAKCDVRCANCHRRKTAIEFNYTIVQLLDNQA